MPETTVIRIICYKLPYELSNQLYHEFENRYKEATYLIEHFSYYKSLRKKVKLIEILLALSIFYKRVITNLDAAQKFREGVRRRSQATGILIGSYELDARQGGAISQITTEFWQLMQRFQLPVFLFEYSETKQFLGQVLKLNKTSGQNRKNNETQDFDPEDLPF